MTRFDFRPMTAETVEEYAAWFTDPETRRRMELPNEGWARYVLTRGLPVAWAAFEKGELVGYVKASFREDRRCAVALVIAPARRGEGLGSAVLREFFKTIVPDQRVILGYIEQDNIPAICNAEKVGFTRISGPDKDGLIEFELDRG